MVANCKKRDGAQLRGEFDREGSVFSCTGGVQMAYQADRKFIPSLHGLRGIMAMWVVLYHTSPDGLGLFQVTRYGYFAVDVFFILSGYVLMHGHDRQFTRITSAEIVAFLQLRWWRVYPLCLVSVVLSVAAFYLAHHDWPPPEHVVASLLIADNWALSGIGVNTPAWSLGVEWLGYLAFPFVAYALFRLNRGQRLTLLAMLIGAAIAYMAWVGGGWDHIYGLPTVVRMATEFGSGCVLFTLSSEPRRWLHGRADLLVGGAVAGLTLVLLADMPLLALPFLILLVYGASLPQSPIGQFLLCSRIPLFLGRISFALYMTHKVVIYATDAVVGRPHLLLVRFACTFAVLAASLLLATVLCIAIEEPVRRWGRSRGRAVPIPGAVREGVS
jgi:peptidoglycan/LPS O-acetylase OafA/YrhL